MSDASSFQGIWAFLGMLGAFGAFCLSVVIALIAYGKSQGRMEEKVEVQERNIADINKRHDDFISSFDRYFKTSDGDPRFMTNSDHKDICEKREEAIQLKLDFICNNVRDTKDIATGTRAQVSQVATDVAIFKEWKNSQKEQS